METRCEPNRYSLAVAGLQIRPTQTLGIGQSVLLLVTSAFLLSWAVLHATPATAGVKVVYTLENPAQFQSVLGNRFATFQVNLDVASDHLSDVLTGKGTIDVLVKFDETYQTASSDVGHWINTATAYGIMEPGTVFEARTGTDLNGNQPDITMKFPKAFLAEDVWFDPSGGERDATIPADKLDFISVVLHETLHGLGFSGFRRDVPEQQLVGAFPEGKKSTFDFFTDWGKPGLSGIKSDTLGFYGPYAMQDYGGPIEITGGEGGYYHLGNIKGADPLADDLMAGATSAVTGQRKAVSVLDRAILRDLGWQALYRAAELPQMLDPTTLSKAPQTSESKLPTVDPEKLTKKKDGEGGGDQDD